MLRIRGKLTQVNKKIPQRIKKILATSLRGRFIAGAMTNLTSLKIPKVLHQRIAAIAAKRTPPTKAPGLACYALDKFVKAEEAKGTKGKGAK